MRSGPIRTGSGWSWGTTETDPREGTSAAHTSGSVRAASLRAMTQVARVRKGALALPEVKEGTHFGMVAFSVRGRIFVSVSKDEQHVRIHVPTSVVESTVAEHPEVE